MNPAIGTRVDLGSLPSTLLDAAVTPGHPHYSRVRSSHLRGGRPALVLQVRTPHQAAEAVAFAATQSVPLAVRSGGHGFSGRSTNVGGIVIDLSALNRVKVLNEHSRLVRIGPGARWGSVAAALQPYGWAISSGDRGGVGVGGLATAGGIGLLGREQGLTIDRMRAAELVLADGRRLRVSAAEHPDLFWAVRGAGFALGVVTAFDFEAATVGRLGHVQMVHDASGTAEFLRAWTDVAGSAPRDTTGFLTIGRPWQGKVIAQSEILIHSDDPDTVRARAKPFADLASLLVERARLVDYPDIVAEPADHYAAEGEPISRSGLLDRLTPAAAQAAARLVTSGASYFFQLRTMGGAIADVDPAATALAHRSAAFQMVAMGPDPHRLDRFWDALRPHFSGLYVSFETDTRPERLSEAYPVDTLNRLVALKKQYDPRNVFHDNFNLSPAL